MNTLNPLSERTPFPAILMGIYAVGVQFLGLVWLSSGQGMSPQWWLAVFLGFLLSDTIAQHLGLHWKHAFWGVWASLPFLALGLWFGLPNLALTHPLSSWVILLFISILGWLPLSRVWRTRGTRTLAYTTMGEFLGIWFFWLAYPLMGWRLCVLCLGVISCLLALSVHRERDV